MKLIARLIIPLTLLNLFVLAWTLSNKVVVTHSYSLYIQDFAGLGDSAQPDYVPTCVIYSNGYCLNPVEEANGKPTQFSTADAKKIVDGVQALIASHKCTGEVQASEPADMRFAREEQCGGRSCILYKHNGKITHQLLSSAR
jgi:hypothetical protein